MSGFRVGFAVGNKDMIQALKKYQTHTNAGMFGALQDAATYALNHYDDFLDRQNETFKRRRDTFEKQLKMPIYHLYILKVVFTHGFKHHQGMIVNHLNSIC